MEPQAAFVSRNELFAGLTAIGFAAGVSEKVDQAVANAGIAAALASTFDVSAIVWVAWGISIVFLLRGSVQPADRSDGILATCVVLTILVPVAPLSWLALTGLAIHILRTSPRPGLLCRGAWILLALTVPMFWSRLLFASLSEFILQVDATLVGWLVGTARVGNAIELADGSGYLWIAPGCSSLANVSLAILCWVTVTKVVNRPASAWDIGWITLACAAVVAINTTRIGLIGFYPAHYELIHGPVGATVASWLILGAIVAVCLLAVRRDLPIEDYRNPGVAFQPRIGIALGLVLAASFILKVSGATSTPEVGTAPVFPDEIAKLLGRQDFQVSRGTPRDKLTWVVGISGECEVRITEVAPQGWQRGLLEALARDQHLLYFFDGASYREQPLMRTRGYYYWNRLNRYLGRSVPSRPVLAVISTSTCQTVPLRELARLSAG